MFPIVRSRRRIASRQEGTTLILALVLLLLATLLSLFAMNVGIFGQRTSANDVRARLVEQTAETALSQAAEWLKANYTTAPLDPTLDSTLWTQCTDEDATYPCGAVEQCPGPNITDSSGSTSTGFSAKTSDPSVDGTAPCSGDLKRRRNMFYYTGGAGYDVNGSGGTTDQIDSRSLPIAPLGSVGNGYTVNYGVSALVCMVKNPLKSTDPTECTTKSSAASSTRLVTLTAVANIPGENAMTTVQTTVGKLTTVAFAANGPPVIASGNISTRGTLQIVTNPNSGGSGVPVSVWTRLDAYSNGTPDTCYLDGYLRNQKGSAAPEFEGVNTKIATCDDCGCVGGAFASDSSVLSQMQGSTQTQGIDILDVDSQTQCQGTVSSGCKPNLNVQPGEFPCDLFAYVFGDLAWEDDAPVDSFCETRKMVTYTGADNVATTMGEDEAYLYKNATFIIPSAANASKVDAARTKTCAILNDTAPITGVQGSAYGIVWDQKGCGVGTNKQAGTVDTPVLLVEDGIMDLQGRVFGLLFVRPSLYNGDTSTLYAATGTTNPTPPSGANCVGTGQLNGSANGAVYGAVVVQGQICKITGTLAIVYNGTVLGNLAGEPALNPFKQLPAAWTDRFAY